MSHSMTHAADGAAPRVGMRAERLTCAGQQYQEVHQFLGRATPVAVEDSNKLGRAHRTYYAVQCPGCIEDLLQHGASASMPVAVAVLGDRRSQRTRRRNNRTRGAPFLYLLWPSPTYTHCRCRACTTSPPWSQSHCRCVSVQITASRVAQALGKL